MQVKHLRVEHVRSKFAHPKLKRKVRSPFLFGPQGDRRKEPRLVTVVDRNNLDEVHLTVGRYRESASVRRYGALKLGGRKPPALGQLLDRLVLASNQEIDDHSDRCLKRAHGTLLLPGILRGESSVSPSSPMK